MEIIDDSTIHECANEVQGLINCIKGLNKQFLLRTELVEATQRHVQSDEGKALAGTPIERVFLSAHEGAMDSSYLYLAVRPEIARWQYVRLHLSHLQLESVSVSDFLQFKERLIEPNQTPDDWILEVDLSPFERDFPKMERAKSIGRGVEYLNRHLCGRLFAEKDKGGKKLFDFLRIHQYQGRALMLNGGIKDVDVFRRRLTEAVKLLDQTDPARQWNEVEPALKKLGFEAGWGRDVRHIGETMNLLSDILEAPEPGNLERFLARIPMIFNIVILSPHGYFGQANVLGKPDTGGQVVYILDQVRALEHEMRASIHSQGLDIEPQILVFTRLIPEAENTTCNQPCEYIEGTKNARILRVPFRYANGEVARSWISRFKIWPFLERYAGEVEKEIRSQLGGCPDIVIGNYSDGNLVASWLASRLGVTQCNIAHALEKTKYLHSDLYWREHEHEHHFSCQFTADLISMNTADFIITSTYQEIAGTADAIGQYESYKSFTLPGLYRVVSGVDSFDPKFNIVSPGADPEIFYPYNSERSASQDVRDEVESLIREEGREDAMGGFDDANKPVLFAMSRLDRIKNMAGLVEWYGACRGLQERANLLLVGGHFDPERSGDYEEKQQISLIRELIQKYQLTGKIRWVVMQTDKARVGEFYRNIARGKGAFIQPALFEAFGLTVVEAMSSGLPVFATCYGGPLEIIEHGKSGFHIDPNHGSSSAELIHDFFARCANDPDHWPSISQGAMDRVAARYTWKRYAGRLLSLSRVYGFWKYISKLEHQETRRYLEMFYGLMFRRLAERVEY